ncbi:YjfI family protein [Pseudomonas sp. Marseille-QA0892]
MSDSSPWTLETLHRALSKHELVASGKARLELTLGDAASLRVTMSDYGDLPVYIAVHGDQVMVDASLVPCSTVKNVHEFNAMVLRTRDLFPLSSVGIETIGGEEVYSMFGALSSISPLAAIVQEIETLSENVLRAAEAFEDHFNA